MALPDDVRKQLLQCLRLGLESSQRAEAPIVHSVDDDGIVVDYHHPDPDRDEDTHYRVKLVPVDITP